MAEQRKVIVPPKIPPPPPPRARTPKNSGATSLLKTTSPTIKTETPPIQISPLSPLERQPKIPRPAPPPPDLSDAAALLVASPATKPSKPTKSPPVPPFPSRQPFVNMNPAGRDLPNPRFASADPPPRKGFLQNVYSRTKDMFSRRKTTTYEPLPKQPTSFASPPPTPQKRGFFKSLFERKSTTTTTPVRLDDSSSDLESSSDLASGYSVGDNSRSEDLASDLEVSGSQIQFADTSSEISASDLEEAVAFERTTSSCSVVDRIKDEQLVTIKVNSAADIRVATTITGEVTTCIRTTKEYKKKGRKE